MGVIENCCNKRLIFQVCPSFARTKLLAVDISNLLFCVGQLLPSVCSNAEELIGLSFSPQKKIIRDIHAKCQELLICLILRCSAFDTLYKVCSFFAQYDKQNTKIIMNNQHSFKIL